jgi:hypothetical protein
VVVLANTSRAHGVAIDDNNVYFTTYQGSGADIVARVSKTVGLGAVSNLATGQDLPSLLAIGGNRLYWTEWTTGSVRSVGLPAGPMLNNAVLPIGSGAPFGIAASATKAYAVSFESGRVFEISPGGGGPIEVAKTAAGGTSMTLQGDDLFVAVQNNPGGVYRVNVNTGTTSNLASGIRAWGVAAGPGDVFFSDPFANTVTRISLGPTLNAAIIAQKLQAPRGLALDATHIYWAEYDRGRIARVPRNATSPTTPEIVATDLAGVNTIALDDNFVYFAALNTGVVGKVAK